MTVLPTETIIGSKVRDAEGEVLGDVEEVMLDADTGHVAYAVLSIGGFLGVGEKLYSVPFTTLEFDQQADQFVLDMSKEELEDAPGFDEKEEPRADYEFLDEVYVFYGVDPYWKARTAATTTVTEPDSPTSRVSS